jgi:hypothetical protein
MREKRNTVFWLGNTIEDLGIDGRILLKWRLKNRMVGCGLDLFGVG